MRLVTLYESDEKSRDAERAAQQGQGDMETRSKIIANRLRSGQLDPDLIPILAAFGDQTATAYLEEPLTVNFHTIENFIQRGWNGICNVERTHPALRWIIDLFIEYVHRAVENSSDDQFLRHSVNNSLSAHSAPYGEPRLEPLRIIAAQMRNFVTNNPAMVNRSSEIEQGYMALIYLAESGRTRAWGGDIDPRGLLITIPPVASGIYPAFQEEVIRRLLEM